MGNTKDSQLKLAPEIELVERLLPEILSTESLEEYFRGDEDLEELNRIIIEKGVAHDKEFFTKMRSAINKIFRAIFVSTRDNTVRKAEISDRTLFSLSHPYTLSLSSKLRDILLAITLSSREETIPYRPVKESKLALRFIHIVPENPDKAVRGYEEWLKDISDLATEGSPLFVIVDTSKILELQDEYLKQQYLLILTKLATADSRDMLKAEEHGRTIVGLMENPNLILCIPLTSLGTARSLGQMPVPNILIWDHQDPIKFLLNVIAKAESFNPKSR